MLFRSNDVFVCVLVLQVSLLQPVTTEEKEKEEEEKFKEKQKAQVSFIDIK